MAKPADLDPDLLRRLQAVVPDGTLIFTVANRRPNWVVELSAAGARVDTEKSRREGSPPQLVPAWMLQIAWDELRSTGVLEQTRLLNELNVKRSAAVVALLAQLPEVTAVSKPVTVLRLVSSS